ncbi:MAG: M23 family metallopeptidase, partial [Duganella sp.]
FGAAGQETVAARIRHMQRTVPPALPAAAAWTVAVAMTGVLAAGALLQPALAVDLAPVTVTATTTATASGATTSSGTAASTGTTSLPGAAASSGTASLPGAAASSLAAQAPADAAPLPWRHPLDRMRVSGFFGVLRDFSARPHPGVDLAAPRGTPVHAAAAGTVTAAGALAENDGRYGTTVIVDTGAGQALYAHLNSVAVKPGDRVAVGQVIGAVGATGAATGPHLHFELRRGGQAVDPALVLTGLEAHATSRALQARRQQLGR